MARVDTVYKWLAQQHDAEVDRALAVGLERAEEAYTPRIVELLQRRKRESAWTGLVANYDRLPERVQERLREPSVLTRAGIAGAMKGSVRHQLNALELLKQCGHAQLCYLASDVLRSRNRALQNAAVEVLQVQAEQVLESCATRPVTDTSCREEARTQRSEYTRALREAVKTYESHRRPEILELALWFATDLGGDLWRALDDARTGCGIVVNQHLADWNSPRLAGFLLLALARQPWRGKARTILESWTSLAELIALVQKTELARHPEIRRVLGQIQHPKWFTANAGNMTHLPADVRAHIPYWACYVGLTEDERLRCLRNWQASMYPEVHRAAVYALASIDHPDALRVLAGVATRPCAMSRFAKWYVAGRRGLTKATAAKLDAVAKEAEV